MPCFVSMTSNHETEGKCRYSSSLKALFVLEFGSGRIIHDFMVPNCSGNFALALLAAESAVLLALLNPVNQKQTKLEKKLKCPPNTFIQGFNEVLQILNVQL